MYVGYNDSLCIYLYILHSIPTVPLWDESTRGSYLKFLLLPFNYFLHNGHIHTSWYLRCILCHKVLAILAICRLQSGSVYRVSGSARVWSYLDRVPRREYNGFSVMAHTQMLSWTNIWHCAKMVEISCPPPCRPQLPHLVSSVLLQWLVFLNQTAVICSY